LPVATMRFIKCMGQSRSIGSTDRRSALERTALAIDISMVASTHSPMSTIRLSSSHGRDAPSHISSRMIPCNARNVAQQELRFVAAPKSAAIEMIHTFNFLWFGDCAERRAREESYLPQAENCTSCELHRTSQQDHLIPPVSFCSHFAHRYLVMRPPFGPGT
jgi:hypothetical protein